MMTHGAAQQSGRQMGMTAAPCLSPPSSRSLLLSRSLRFLSRARSRASISADYEKTKQKERMLLMREIQHLLIMKERLLLLGREKKLLLLYMMTRCSRVADSWAIGLN